MGQEILEQTPVGTGVWSSLSLGATDDKAACALLETLMLDRVRVGGRWE